MSESPQTQELIELCLALPESLPTLRKKAEVRLEETHQAADTFFAQVDAQKPEFYQEFRPHLERIEKAFRAYADALETILDDTFEGSKVARILAKASRDLKVGMASYEEAFLSRGPSSYPVVNLFRNVAQALADGRVTKEIWLATCARYQKYYSSALVEIEKSRAQDRPGLPERKSALGTILTILTELEVLQAEELEPLLSRLSAGHADLDKAFDIYHRHEFAEGPTRAPKINWLIKAAQGVLSGTYKPQVLESLAQELLDITQVNLAELKAMSRNKLDSAVLTEELERMVEAVEEIEDVLIFFLDYCQGAKCDDKKVQEAIEDLIESGDALAESTKIVAEVQERAGKVTCVQCQAVQEKGAKSCVACGAMLPQLPEEGVYAHASSSFQVLEGNPEDVDRDEIMTDVMQELFEACEAFMKGRLTFETLAPQLDESLLGVDKAQAELHRMQVPSAPQEASHQEQDLAEEFIDLADDALVLLSQGVEECRQGVLLIRRGAESEDLETLRSGMRQYYEGTQKMWQVRRLEKQFTDYLEQDE